MKKKYRYVELSPGRQKRLLRNLVARYQIEGRAAPEQEANDKLKTLGPQSTKAWDFRNLGSMKAVDAKRKEIGLEPFYKV